MKRDEDLRPGSISGWDVKRSPHSSQNPRRTRKGPDFPHAGDGLSRGRKENIFKLFSSIPSCSVWHLDVKIPNTSGTRVPSLKPSVPLSARKEVTPTPLKLQETLCLSLENTLALNISQEALNKKLQLPLLPLSLFAPCTPKAFVSTLLHMYWSYFWPRVTWLCLHNWVPTSWSAALIVCKIIAGKCLIPEKCLQSSVCLYLKSEIKK